MYFMLQLTVVVLMLYLKLIGLFAIPLIESHKLSESRTLLSRSGNVSSSSSSSSVIGVSNQQNLNDNESILVATKTIPKLKAINALIINPEKHLPVFTKTKTATKTKAKASITTTTTFQGKLNNVGVDISLNHFPINKDNENNKNKHSNNNNNKNKNKYSYYNVSNVAANDRISSSKNNNKYLDTVVNFNTLFNSTKKTPNVNELLILDSHFGFKKVGEKSSDSKNDGNNAAFDGISKKLGIALGNILLNNINNNETDRFLMNYNDEKDNTCLLDIIKDTFMWWLNKNGTLRHERIFNFTSRRNYLDLSYRNITSDGRLLSRARSFIYLHGSDIIAFSAAKNNLTGVPYRTLSLMNTTLKYLTLKGNQFVAYAHEIQKDVISRILNDKQHHTDNSDEMGTGSTTPYKRNTDTYHIMNTNHKNTINTSNTNERNAHEAQSSDYPFSKQSFRKIKNKVLGNSDGGIAWATFPLMPALLELDISNCHIEFITRDVFKNLTGLRRLFLSHNKMLTIPGDSFYYLKKLQYLDLSFIKVLDTELQMALPTAEAVYNLIYGIKIQQKTFQALPELVYLDLSHTKLTRNSAMAFTHLGKNVRYMSLCYTAFPMFSNALFKKTALVGLDLSGNSYAAYHMTEDSFEGVSNTLKYLYFDRSNIKDLSWLRYLGNISVLGLSYNNINYLSVEIFSPLKSLKLLDLSSNHIGNWYNRVFTYNEELRVLNLRDNNINIITSEMLRDFQLLDYLSLGDNNFVCDCLLHDLVEIAEANNKEAECSRNLLQEATEIIMDNAYLVKDYLPKNLIEIGKLGYKTLKSNLNLDYVKDTFTFDISPLLVARQMPQLQRSYENIKKSYKHRPKLHFITQFYSTILTASSSNSKCPAPKPVSVHEKLNRTMLKFQLVDYEDEHYWCFNETERLNFTQLNCGQRKYVEDLTRKLHTLTKYVVASVISVMAVSLLCVLIYLKRWHIHYYFSYLKSAALVSVAAKEAADQLNTLAETDPNLVYDIFISYCQSDREWVLEELLPNVEESGDISICMHERDFQIGLTILDNIVSCIDRSRALMLIISSNFLLSHWCQFEMHIAQHRIFEVSKEHLILVFLEDIPRNKRPKTLQYLMEVKTYIKWPSASKNSNKSPSADERKFFWKRLKRSLENIGLHPYPKESHA